ncbi:MAG TPA: hypothetical protein DEF51_37290 [Myxococcales bacterium]|nr:hypothetical protein [Myxococcales bacterium]
MDVQIEDSTLTAPRDGRVQFIVAREGEVVGAALRTRDRVKPVYVSIGHRVSIDTATRAVVGLAPRYRLPETTRAADQRVNALRRGN